MAVEILTVLGNILLSVISNGLYDKGKNLFETRKKEKIEEEINNWLNNFFTSHLDKVFESTQFIDYVKYQKPFEKIKDYVFGSNNTNSISEQDFIIHLASECKEYIIKENGKCVVLEESSIRDLFADIIGLYKKILYENTSDGDKLILYQDAQNSIKEQNALQNYESTLLEIRDIITKQGVISDDRTIKTIYNFLSSALWKGQAEDVNKISQILFGKNEDLENAIKIRLAFLSDYYNELRDDALLLCNSIKNLEIRDDIIRLLVLEYFESSDKLRLYLDLISDETLKKIAVAISDHNLNKIIKTKKIEENKCINYTFEVENGFQSEYWLIHRLCAITIYSLNTSNATKVVSQLIKSPNVIDQLLIWEHYCNEIASLSIDGKFTDTQEFRNYVNEMKEHLSDYIHSRLDIKKRFYLTLLRGLILIGDSETEDIFRQISEQGIEDPKIDAYKLEEEINKGTATQENVIETALRTKAYWLLVLYGESLNNYKKELEIINQIKWIIGNSFIVFERAVICTYNLKGKKEALELIKQYENQYSDQADFWVRAYSLSETTDDFLWIINSIISKMQEGKLIYGSYSSEKNIVIILVKEKYFEKASELLKRMEGSYGKSEDISRMKIDAFMQQDRQIDVLTEILNQYELLKNDVRVIDLLLFISLRYNRPISDEVLSHAKQFDNSRILMLIAEIEYNNRNITEAKNLAIRSMLSSQSDNEELFDLAFKYFMDDTDTSTQKVKRIDLNTYFEMKNQEDNSYLKFIVYKDKLIPAQEIFWKDVWHIYIDEAIEKGFLRLEVGDIIQYAGNTYEIMKIAPMDMFYSQICMNSMIKRNHAWTITGQNAEELKQGIVSMLNKFPHFGKKEWDKFYSDFNTLSLPLYCLKDRTNLEYGQLMRTVMQDPTVVVREFVMPIRFQKNREYILTYTTLVCLHKLGINPLDFYEKIKIPNTVITQTTHEADMILNRNNRDIVASMCVEEDDFFVFEYSENDKRENVRLAVDFKKYVSLFSGLDNDKDIVVEQLSGRDIIQVIGICDYDAISLAHNRDAVLVTCEMMTAELTKLTAAKTDVSGIIDFLCLIEVPIVKLFDIIKQLINYRFYAIFTPTVIKYVSDMYDGSSEAEKTEVIKKWNEILNEPKKLDDENFLSKFKMSCLESYRFLVDAKLVREHPIISSFCLAVFYYNDYRIQLSVVNGYIQPKVIQVNRNTIMDTKKDKGD